MSDNKNESLAPNTAGIDLDLDALIERVERLATWMHPVGKDSAAGLRALIALARQAAPAPVLATDEREGFEAWHRSKFATKHSTGQPTRDMHNGVYAEKYGPEGQQQMWEAFQAGAALARAVQPAPAVQDEATPQAPAIDVKHEFEMWASNRGDAAVYIGDGLYQSGHITDQAEAFAAGVALARTAASQVALAQPAAAAPEVVGWQNRMAPDQIVEGKNPPDASDKWVALTYAAATPEQQPATSDDSERKTAFKAHLQRSSDIVATWPKWKQGVRAPASDSALPAKAVDASEHRTCPACQGNDSDMPCAYPSERKPGCLRDARLDAMSMDEVIAAGIARGRQEEAADWAECERIANLPAVDEVLRGFSEDPTGNNGTMVVRAVLESIAAPADAPAQQAAEPGELSEADKALDRPWQTHGHGHYEYIETICDAYESGIGDGLSGKPLMNPYNGRENPDQNAAFEIGHVIGAERKIAAPVADAVAQPQPRLPGDWTVEWDAYSPPGTIRLNSAKWGGCFLRPPELRDIGLHALAYRFLKDVLDAAECKTCGGSRVDPGGLPVCRDCAAPEVGAVAGAGDAERLDFMADEECRIEIMAGPLYRVHWPDLGEWQSEWSKSPREAIDAAMSAAPATQPQQGEKS